MPRTTARGALLLFGICLALASPACGKKAPLRLSDDRTAEKAPALRARVREGRVTLDFRVPAHRTFPEREDPWVLARVLRQAGRAAEVVEAGAILKTGGFAFDSPLSWSDQVPLTKDTVVYRVEFRDDARRRRALSEPLAVSGGNLPAGPPALTAVGRLRSIVLAWEPPGGAGTGVRYRIYRREASGELLEQISPEPVEGRNFVDSRIESGREYCYVVRAVLQAKALDIEGPPSPESCSRPAVDDLPPARPPAAGP